MLNFWEYLWNEERAWELAADTDNYDGPVTDGGISDSEDRDSQTFDRYDEEEESRSNAEQTVALDNNVFAL